MKKFNGFTLIELMIVIAIIGILAAIATSAFKKRDGVKAGVGAVTQQKRSMESK